MYKEKFHSSGIVSHIRFHQVKGDLLSDYFEDPRHTDKVTSPLSNGQHI